MSVERIHTFHGFLLAFYRPIKRTFYLMEWDSTSTPMRWKQHAGEHPPFTVHKTTAHSSGSVTIKIKKSRGAYETIITCNGRFLKGGDLCIPIATAEHPPPVASIKQEYVTVALENQDQYTLNTLLWRCQPPPAPAPAVPETPKISPIPRRIAWLIADDACKNNENCPISLEEISPITASVTTCFHVFQTEHLKTWFQANASQSCPVCRKKCVAQDAYEQV